jgi:hypothetical protein
VTSSLKCAALIASSYLIGIRLASPPSLRPAFPSACKLRLSNEPLLIDHEFDRAEGASAGSGGGPSLLIRIATPI